MKTDLLEMCDGDLVIYEHNMLHSQQPLNIFKMIRPPYNVRIIELWYYKAYQGYISAQ